MESFAAWFRSILSTPQLVRGRRGRPRIPECFFENLEDRLAPAVTAFAGGVLTIDYSSAGEAIVVSNAGGAISLSGATFTGAGASGFSGVNSIVVTDSGDLGEQSMTIGGAVPLTLAGGLNVSGIEDVSFEQSIDASGVKRAAISSESSAIRRLKANPASRKRGRVLP